MAAPMPAVIWPVRRGGTPRSRSPSTCRKLRPMPRCAPRMSPWASPAPGRCRPAALVDPPVIQQDVAERQGLLRVVGVEAAKPPAIGLPLPGLHAVDVILHPTVVRLDLLGGQALQRSAQGVSDAIPSKHPRTRSIRDR